MKNIAVAVNIVKRANRLLAQKFQTLGLDAVRLKKNEEIVTDADLASNKLITAALLKHFPNDDIISEEAKMIDNPGKKIWYVDPLDGTTNFAYGFRDFAVCLGQSLDNKIKLGLIGLPLAKEVYWAEENGKAYLNGKQILVSSTSSNYGSRHMLMLCGGHTHKSQAAFLRILRKLNVDDTRFRVMASAGVELSSVACGRADGCILTKAFAWDVVAGVLLVRAAGGKVTDFKGKNWQLGDTEIIASNGLIHDKLLALVSGK